MSFLLIHADEASTLVADDPFIHAAEIASLRNAVILLREAGSLRETSEERVAAVVEEARAAGHAEGLAAGRAEAKAESEAALFRLMVRAAQERRRQRQDVGALALEVVRRITRELGAETSVAALADRATAELLPDAVAIVRVPPTAFAATSARLAAHSALTVEADAGLEPFECVVETALGTTRAGLETQLARIADAWAAAEEKEAADA